MKFLFRWIFRIGVVLIVLATALVLLRGVIVRSLIEQQFQAATGIEAHIGSVEVALWNPSITLANVRLQETAEFGGVEFAQISEIYAVYDRAALSLHELRFRLLRFNVRDLRVVESKEGKVNLERFTMGARSGAGGTNNSAQATHWRFGGADTLNLSLGTIHYISLRHPGESQQAIAGLDNEMILNVRTPEQIADAVLNRMVRKGITITGWPAK